MYDTIVRLHLDGDTVDARVSLFQDGDVAYYSLGDGPDFRGTILVQPARFGMHPRHGVMLTFGHGSDGIEVGDWGLTGTVLANPPSMAPGPHPTADQYPIGQVRKDDPDAADLVATLVTAIATHYADTYTGRGLR